MGKIDRYTHSQNTKKAFGGNMRAYREAAGLSRESLAKSVGCSTSLIAAWEQGAREPGLGDIVSLRHALGVTADDLIGGPTTPAPYMNNIAQSLTEVERAIKDAQKALKGGR